MQILGVLVCILTGAAFALIAYHKTINKEKTLLVYSVIFFRFITVFSLCLLLTNSIYEKVSIIPLKPELIFFFDNSSSIKIVKQNKSENEFLNEIRSNKKLYDKYNISFLSFGEDIKFNIDTLNFNEKSTNFYKVIHFLKNNSNENTTSVICSDGIVNTGIPIEDLEIMKNGTIYNVFFGDSIQRPDIFIEKIISNKTAKSGNKFPVKLRIMGNNVPIDTYNINILNSNKNVGHFQIKNETKDFSIEKEIFINAETKGINRFEVKIEILKNESNTTNNNKIFFIDVIEKKNKILAITSTIIPELGVLKRVYGSNENFDLEIKKIENINNNINFNDINLFILINPTANFSEILTKIKGKNIFWILTSKDINNDVINNFYKENIISNINLPTDIPDNFNTKFNIFKVTENNIISSLPPLEQNKKPDITVKKNNIILYKKIKDIEIPTMFLYNDKNNRDLFLLATDFWKWNIYNYKIYDNHNFIHDLLYKIGIFLVTDEKDNFFLDHKYSYQYGEDIHLEARYLNEISETKLTDDLKIYLKKDTINYSYNFNPDKDDIYKCEIKGLETGEYIFSVKDNTETLMKGKIIVEDVDLEYDNLKGNIEGLRILASKNNGKLYTYQTRKNLIAEIENNDKSIILSKRKEITTLQNNWIILTVILISITSEWIIRRYLTLL